MFHNILSNNSIKFQKILLKVYPKLSLAQNLLVIY